MEKLPHEDKKEEDEKKFDKETAGILTEKDLRILSDGVPSVVEKILERFRGELPDAVVYMETSARPLFYVFDPVFTKLSKEASKEKPLTFFFQTSGVHEGFTGSGVGEVKKKRVAEKERAQEIKEQIKKTGKNPHKIVLIDDFGLLGSGQKEALRAFGKETPFFYVSAEEEPGEWASAEEKKYINKDTVGTFTGYQGRYQAGRFGWFNDYRNSSSANRNYGLKNESIGVYKTEGKYVAAQETLEEWQNKVLEEILFEDIAVRYAPDRERERAYEIFNMTAEERAQLNHPWDLNFIKKLDRVNRALEISSMSADEVEQLTNKEDVELADIVKFSKEKIFWPGYSGSREEQEYAYKRFRERQKVLRKELRELGENIAKKFTKKRLS